MGDIARHGRAVSNGNGIMVKGWKEIGKFGGEVLVVVEGNRRLIYFDGNIMCTQMHAKGL